MATELCTPQMLNFSFCREGQTGSRPPYLLFNTNMDKLANSRDVLEQLRNQFGCRELAVEEVWRSYQTVYTENGGAVRYKMTTGTAIESKLGHVPMTVIAWRETGTGPSDIEIIGCVDTSRMPSNHPNIFNVSSPSPLSSSSKRSKIIRTLLASRRTSSSTWPNSPCQTQKLPSNLLLDIWNRIAQIRTCILIALLFFAFLSLGIFLGVFLTLKKSYGYSLGDAFTLAGFVLAVGIFCTSVLFSYHFPNCECWRRARVKLCTE